LTLDDRLMARIRRIAAETNRTISEVIDEALRETLARRSARSKSGRRVRLPTVKGGRLRPGVDLDDTSGLVDLMEERNGPS
jgi:hypothetical protein